ncbi:acyl-CoA thioesterase [Microbacterium sediminis]|uniref:4-hydroxybenzoyl-CoA thioesterase n=1 Tax=Microbacterium sediminis TaxID=904291 RepID=A0A1B9NGC3_9MICO|nr:thioesterase family protein [Microbacterium sediminis]OCG75657.1 4-hydroxybenzoyl-CoA thioesterase [Microbacterium sediminis]QBR74055.1 acyl-CoA thioesterase [Microbacterium sediminis]
MTRLHVPVHLRWGDMDAFNHVNNATLVKILEEARIRAFWKHEDPAQRVDTAVFDQDMRVGEEGPYFTLIAKQGIEYLAPIPYQQAPLDIRLWFTRFGGSSAEIAYEVWGGPDDATLFGRATTVIVLVSQESGGPVRMPEALRAAWGPYLEEPVDQAVAR